MKKIVILVIDDEPAVRRLLSKVLSGEGYQAITAANGEEAVDIAAKKAIGLALVDLKMPGIDGIETIRRIKRVNVGTAFIVITAFGQMQSVKAATDLGVYDYITKPFDLDYLKHLIKHIAGGLQPKGLPYAKDMEEILSGELTLSEAKKKKIESFKKEVKEKKDSLKQTDAYLEEEIAKSFKSLSGLMKYRAKKVITNMYFIVTLLGVIIGGSYGYIYGIISSKKATKVSSSTHLSRKKSAGIQDFYDKLSDLVKWLKIHTLQDKEAYEGRNGR